MILNARLLFNGEFRYTFSVMLSLSRQLQARLKATALKQWPDLKDRLPVIQISRPGERRHGDYASNLAMQLAPLLNQAPMDIAQQLASNATLKLVSVKEVLVAPPGFINFFLDQVWLQRQPGRILNEGETYGRSELGQRRRLHLEFISANPTGPLHLGNGRGGFTGDALANVLSLAGYRIHREYYVNDQGKQVDTLAESVTRRYFQLQGIPVDYPDYCYQGEYVTDLAKNLKLDQLSLGQIDRAKNQIKGRAFRAMLAGIKQTVSRTLRIRFDRWFLESELFQKKFTERALAKLRERDMVYEQDGAVWLKTSQFGDEKDRVLVKANGEFTYFLSDVAYTWEKFAIRKFDRAIILLGADHHGYVGRMQAVVKALGWDGRLEIRLMQLVRLMSNGAEVRMSKRSGTFVTLDELVEEVGLDVARWFFLMLSPNTHMDFDLDLAKEHSDKNQVFYVQYAHARIASIIKNTRPLIRRKQVATKPLLEDGSAFQLIKNLLRFPELVEACAESLTVHELTNYALELARDFHDFYTRVRVIDRDIVNQPALELAEATQLVIRQTLGLLGIKAPEKM